jgi:osmotically-inducible protein OsmY
MKTDAQLQQGVIAVLKREPSVIGSNIDVEVKEGHVTLIGTVKSWAERDLALLRAWGAPGIRNIAHKLVVAN